MPNKLTLTTAVVVPNLAVCRVAKIGDIDEDANTMFVDISLWAVGWVPHPTTFRLDIANGRSDALVANGSPANLLDVVRHAASTVITPTGFNQVLAAYKSGGRDSVLSMLATLGCLPAGAVS